MNHEKPNNKGPENTPSQSEEKSGEPPKQKELGGQKGPEPTRYGDWEKNGRCTDF